MAAVAVLVVKGLLWVENGADGDVKLGVSSGYLDGGGESVDGDGKNIASICGVL